MLFRSSSAAEKKALSELQKASDRIAAQIEAHVRLRGAEKYRLALADAKASIASGKPATIPNRADFERQHEDTLDAIKAAGATHAEEVIRKCSPIVLRFADQIDKLCDSLAAKAKARRTSIDGPDTDLIRWQAKHLRRRANDAVPHWSQSPRRMLGDFIEL